MNYQKESEQRGWKFDIEMYYRYARLYAMSRGWVKDRCKQDCERIKGYWPNQAACFEPLAEEPK
jgi:glucan-binding YG repeat protein